MCIRDRAQFVQAQLAEGLGFLVGNAEAMRCFGFMNEVMAQQRIHSQIAEARSRDSGLDLATARARVLGAGPSAHSWRAFQIAFILMQVKALTLSLIHI